MDFIFTNLMFAIVPIMFITIFIFFIISFVRSIKTWNKNNNSPRLTVPAVVVSKRTAVSHHRHANGGDTTGAHGFHTTSSSSYFVTFQFESEDRLELGVSGAEYGMLVEGDIGKLTFQGTRYISFERNINE